MKALVGRRVRRLFLFIVIICGSSCLAVGQDLNWSGVWSSNVTLGANDSDTYVTISKITESDFVYVSCNSSNIPILNFFGEGKINDNKELEVITSKGDKYIFFEAWDSRYKEVFSILSLNVGDVIESVYRIEAKLTPGNIFTKGNEGK